MARLWLALFLGSLSLPARGDDGAVTLPLQRWEGMLDGVAHSDRPVPAPIPVLHLGRVVAGRFDRGVFSGTLDVRLLVPEGYEGARVPVLDADTSIDQVLLDGRPTSLLREGDMYTVGVGTAGEHRVQVRFYQGREDDRFARRLSFDLPQSGPTRLELRVPEWDVEAWLTHGALTEQREDGSGTLMVGNLDASGKVELGWKRRRQSSVAGNARTEARLDALFTLDEALVRGLAEVKVKVLEGETDRVTLRLPEGLEVLDVSGEAVLQWTTEPGGTLAVLLRYLVEDEVNLQVRFQFPTEADAGVKLRVPLPADGVPLEGTLGVLGPAGLQVEPRTVTDATALALRDMPVELTDLTNEPLLMGFAFSASPSITLDVTRHDEVALTSTLVDDVQASTVLIEDGTEITKVRLRLRNNTRQYLGVTLPEGASLTHARLDGGPVRPALAAQGDERHLLFPLRQSERVDPGAGRSHVVLSGETLSSIAGRYYGDPSLWRPILDANNDQLYYPDDLTVGQRLRIPVVGGGAVEETSFVIELAYKRSAPRMGWVGRRDVTLPSLDVDTVELTWHLFLPDAVTPLGFDANLTQYSGIHYDPLRRLLDFLDRASWTRRAWAGSGSSGRYSSILLERKAIYQAENERRQSSQEVTSSFPLVGELYRFKRILLGQETPRITVTWMSRDLVPVVHWSALAAAFALAWTALRGGRSRWLVAAGGMAGLLVVAHHVLGVHRRLLWGVDLALLASLLQGAGPPLRAAGARLLARPSSALDALTWRNLVAVMALVVVGHVVLSHPLLLSSAGLVLLIGLRRVLR